MSGSTGLAGLVVTALVAALVAFAVTALLGAPVPAPAPPTGSGSGRADLDREVAALRREVEELRAAGPAAARPRPAAQRAPGASGPSDGTPEGAEGEAETLPSSRDELLTLIDQRIADAREQGTLDGSGPGGWKPPPPKPRLTIEEAGAAMGLSAFEIDAVHRAYKDAEMELITSVMGTADMDAIKEELKAARDDPDRKAALINKAVGNVIRNLGRVATINDRRDRDLRKVLSEDQMSRLKDYDLKPTMADGELEDIMKDAFGNR